MISHNGNTIEENGGDIDHNISKNNYDPGFPSMQKIISTPFFALSTYCNIMYQLYHQFSKNL